MLKKKKRIHITIYVCVCESNSYGRQLTNRRPTTQPNTTPRFFNFILITTTRPNSPDHVSKFQATEGGPTRGSTSRACLSLIHNTCLHGHKLLAETPKRTHCPNSNKFLYFFFLFCGQSSTCRLALL